MPLDLKVVAEGLGFPEGPVAMADGSVLFVDIKTRRSPGRAGREGRGRSPASRGAERRRDRAGRGGLCLQQRRRLHVRRARAGRQGSRADAAKLSRRLDPAGRSRDRRGHAALRFLQAARISSRPTTSSSTGQWRILVHRFGVPGRRRDPQGRRLLRHDRRPPIDRKAATIPTANGIGLSPDGNDGLRVRHAIRAPLGPRPRRRQQREAGAAARGHAGPGDRHPARASSGSTASRSRRAAASAWGRCSAQGITRLQPRTARPSIRPVPRPFHDQSLLRRAPTCRTSSSPRPARGRILKTRWPRPGLRLAFNA